MAETFLERFEAQKPQCPFGTGGTCCKNCNLGPCRISKKAAVGVCGADRDVIAARNLVRHICAGSSAHSDHGRGIAHTMFLAASGKAEGYSIKDPEKLKVIAFEYGVQTDGRSDNEIAGELAEKALAEFGRQEGELTFLKRAPKKQQEIWRKYNIAPRGIDREIVEMMHRTNMGVDNDYRNLLIGGMKAALTDGWGGSMIATELSDILFGSPQPIRAKANLGVLKEDEVNILVHGHEPILSEALVAVVQDSELLEFAKSKGAKGINLAGICCTANEILMRHGIPVAGSFLQQEIAINTGAVELMLVDVQCVMPAIVQAAERFHTKIIATSEKAKFTGVETIALEEDKALSIAKTLVKKAIENFPAREVSKVNIPKETMDLIAGFTTENIFHHLGGRFRGTYRPLNDNIMNGRIRGVAGVVGCDNPKMKSGGSHIEMVKELIKHDVLVVQTGCSAIACAKEGLLRPEAAFEFAGKGLQEVCATVGIPPVLHNGSCVDNSRILIEGCEMVKEGGIGESLDELPVAGAAPEWMSEKAMAIGWYFVASGIMTVFGNPMPVKDSENVMKFMTEDVEQITGGKWAFEADPVKAAHLMIGHIDKKRAALKLKPMMYR